MLPNFVFLKLSNMPTLQQTYAPSYNSVKREQSLYSQFTTWCKGQEKYRFGWLGAIIAGHGCVLTPITLFSLLLSGNSIVLWIICMSAMAMALITNLAAMPTKITIPVFFFTVLVDLTIIGYSIASHFMV
jgi:hypothetical protein